MANGHWQYPHLMGNPEYIGFVYLIVNTTNGRSYLGRKLYTKGGNKTVRKNGKRIPNPSLGKSSNWRVYKSSCKELLTDIDTLGKDSFQFYCIAEYVDKRDLHYGEVKLIMEMDMLINSAYYNNHCPDIYCIPPCSGSRKRREKVQTLIDRSIKSAETIGIRSTTCKAGMSKS